MAIYNRFVGHKKMGMRGLSLYLLMSVDLIGKKN